LFDGCLSSLLQSLRQVTTIALLDGGFASTIAILPERDRWFEEAEELSEPALDVRLVPLLDRRPLLLPRPTVACRVGQYSTLDLALECLAGRRGEGNLRSIHLVRAGQSRSVLLKREAAVSAQFEVVLRATVSLAHVPASDLASRARHAEE
jgi:hypothetical protein